MAFITRWDAARKQTLKRLIDQGLRYRDIASKLGTTEAAISTAAQDFGFSRKSIPDQRFTANETDRIERLWNDGLSAGRIAKLVGRTRNSIIGLIYRQGWKRGFAKPVLRVPSGARAAIGSAPAKSAARSPLCRFSQDDDQQVMAGFHAGLSNHEIAMGLGRGFTKNHIASRIGVLVERGLLNYADRPRQALPGNRARKTQMRSAVTNMPKLGGSTPAHIDRPDPRAPAPALTGGGERITLLTLARHGQCRWPHGDPLTPDFHFCARPATGVYCDYHHRRSVQPKTVKEGANDRAA